MMPCPEPACVSVGTMDNLTKPRVSVVIPNYNHARFLRRRVDSVLQQTFQDFEIILLDDCSTDDSRSILSEYSTDPRVRIEFNKRNSGSTFKQWNKGVRLARGEYVWIAESDDYADKRLLEKLLSRLAAEPTTVLCYCRSWRVSSDGDLAGFLDTYLPDLGSHKWTGDFWADGREECRKYLIRCCTVLSASSVVFRREVYWQVGGADEKLVLCGDWKTWVSMALTGGGISYVGDPLNYYRFHAASVTEKSLRNGVWAAEALGVTRWMLQKVTPDGPTLTKVRDDLSHLWIPAARSSRTPFNRRWAILRDAMAIDPRALRRLARSSFRVATDVIRRTVRIGLWHPLLDVTRPVRHALGLRQQVAKRRLTK